MWASRQIANSVNQTTGEWAQGLTMTIRLSVREMRKTRKTRKMRKMRKMRKGLVSSDLGKGWNGKEKDLFKLAKENSTRKSVPGGGSLEGGGGSGVIVTNSLPDELEIAISQVLLW